jgi:hypothetical protein
MFGDAVALLNHKVFLLSVIFVGALAFLRMVLSLFKMKVISDFENGMSRHYLVKDRPFYSKGEFLFFSFRHLDIGQVSFLFICWIIRKADPNVTLHIFVFSP